MRKTLLFAVTALTLSCQQTPDLPQGAPTPPTYFTSKTTNTRFTVAEHFLASVEMQISGEPFAQLLGANLADYNRFDSVTDHYYGDDGQLLVDPLSYSIAVESYEYSKQPMNNTSFESGAGLALEFGPLLNPTGLTGDAGTQLLIDRFQHFGDLSSSSGLSGTNWIVKPAPAANQLNAFGWPGFWPVFAEFRSFSPEVQPSNGFTRMCTINGGYVASSAGATYVGDYECGYNSLNLANRDAQVEKVIEPAALGFALWKQGLWTINYWQTLHDTDGNPIIAVAAADMAQVGVLGNTVVGQYPDPNDPTGNTLIDGVKGVFLGDIPLEGWQGLTMLDEMDNKSALVLLKANTSDGSTVGGFASVKEAIDYDYAAPLRWWPAAIDVTESKGTPPDPTMMPPQAWRDFPQPTKLTISDPTSRLWDLTGMAGGFSEFFALTDFNNPDIGGQASSRATFDGDPFAADNQHPDGEDSPHDRALAAIKVALVNMDRLHYDATNKVLVDESTVAGGKAQTGTTVTTLTAAYSIVGLRTALRSISGTLALYSNDTPDQLGGPTALDGAKLDGAPAPLPARIITMIRAQADFIVAHLINSDGSVANSYDLAKGAADPSPTLLQSEASAIRGLLDAYLATSDESYRQAATRVYNDLDQRFWMRDVRAFRTTAGVDKTLTYTPLQFGAIQGALRQSWKLIGNLPGNERLAAELLQRVQRTNKLIANGWDDANDDNVVQYPNECAGAGLQMGERALTGELSQQMDDGDGDHDCVLEISVAKLPSALAAEVVFTRR